MKLFKFAIVIFLSVSLTAMVRVEDVKTVTLENSMKVLLLEDHSIPNATKVIFDLEADRIANLDLNDKMVESERGVTVEKAKTIIGKYFSKNNLQFVLIGKASEIRDVVKKYGEMTTKEIKTDGF